MNPDYDNPFPNAKEFWLEGESYKIIGPNAIKFKEIQDEISEILGKNVKIWTCVNCHHRNIGDEESLGACTECGSWAWEDEEEENNE